MTKTTITACPLDCYGVCSFRVTTEGDRLLKLEPNTDHPVTGNLICSKGRSHLARRDHPERITEPRLRTADGWRPISWDEAMTLMTDRIRDCLNTDGHHSIASYMGGGAAGKLKGAMELFFQHLGGGTVFTGGLCWSAGIAAQTLDFGKVVSHSPQDLEHASAIVLWGKNPADTHFHLMPHLAKARTRGARVLLIDPVASATAAFADAVISPMPGTDWALAAALIRRLQDAGSLLVPEAQAVEKDVPGLLETLKGLELSQLLSWCGIAEAELDLLAAAYGAGGPCATYVGYGLQRYAAGGAAVRLIDLAAYLTGHIGRPGGGVSYANKVNSGLFDLGWAEPRRAPEPRRLRQGCFGSDILSAQDPPVRLLFIACGNPALQMPDSSAVHAALAQVETVVVIDHFMTDTAALADLVLPATYFLEEEDVISSGMWNGTIHYAPPAVPPRGQARSELRIFSELAARLQLAEFPQLPEDEWLRRLLKPAEALGITLEALRESGWVPSPRQEAVPWSQGCFQTPSGRFNPLPAAELKALADGLGTPEEGSLPLISQHRRDSINSQHTGMHPDACPVVRLHGSTAAGFGLKAGDSVVLEGNGCRLSATVEISEAVRPGVAAMLQGGWRYRQQNLNGLIPSGFSDIGGQALINGGRVRLTKV